MSIEVSTAPGIGYVASFSTAGSVQAVLPDGSLMLIAEADKARQVGFVAISDAVLVSDDKARVTPFKRAALSVLGGGESEGSGGDAPAIVVDQSFNPDSPNAQSGTAIDAELRSRVGNTTWNSNQNALENLRWLSFPSSSGGVALLLGADYGGNAVRFVLDEYPLRVLGEQTFEVACSLFQVNTGAVFNNGLSVNGDRMNFNGIPVATEGTLDERYGAESGSVDGVLTFKRNSVKFTVGALGRSAITFANSSDSSNANVYISCTGGLITTSSVDVRASFLAKSINTGGSLTVGGTATFNGDIIYGSKEIGAYMKEQLALPPGTIIPSLATGMPGWLRCQGQTVSKTTYAALYAVIGDMYKLDDDTDDTLFRLPDFKNRTFWGAWGNLGSYLEAGLPEITGNSHPIVDAGPGGAFSIATVSNYYDLTLTSSAKSTESISQSFDASRSNSIYGASDTVQPPAVAVNIFIKT